MLINWPNLVWSRRPARRVPASGVTPMSTSCPLMPVSSSSPTMTIPEIATPAPSLRPAERRASPRPCCGLEGLPPKGDVSDWLDAGGAPDDLLRLAEAALERGDDGDDEPAPDALTFTPVSNLQGRAIPSREWLVPAMIPDRTVTHAGRRRRDRQEFAGAATGGVNSPGTALDRPRGQGRTGDVSERRG